MADDSEWTGLPIKGKIEHKIWKARLQGFTEMANILYTLEDKNETALYLEGLKKAISDVNVIVQEKAMEIFHQYLILNLPLSERLITDTVSAIISKAFTAKPKVKQLGIDICLQLIENEKYDAVLEALNTGLLNKQPRIVSACADIISQAIKEFGPKIISYKIFIDNSAKLFNNGDKLVRDSAKCLFIELYKWLKTGISPYLANIKTVQLKELEESFAAIQDKACVTRYIVSEKKNLEVKVNNNIHSQEIEDSDVDETGSTSPKQDEIDPYDILEPVDILSKIAPDFYTAIIEAKWSIRKEALDALEKLTSSPKIANGSFSELIIALKKIISSDANVNVMLTAVKCVEGLARGLRKDFSPHAVPLLVVILEKFKDRKPAVVNALRLGVDSLYDCVDFNSIWDSVVPFLNHKNPAIKEEVIRFIERIILKFKSGNVDKSIIKNISNELIKSLDDGCPTVRDSGYETVVNLMNVAGEKHVQIYFEGIGDFKKQKLKDLFSKLSPVVVVAKEPTKKATVTKPTENSKSAKPISSEISVAPKVKKVEDKPKKTVNKPTKTIPNFEKDQLEPSEQEINEADASTKGEALFGVELLTNLSGAVWKERLAAHETLTNVIKEIPPSSDFPSQVICKLLDQKPGWKDSNFQVLKAKYNIISILTKKQSPFSERVSLIAVNNMAEKISDAKLKDQIITTLLDLCEVTSPNFITVRLISCFKSIKNLRSQADILLAMSKIVEDFGFKLDLKFHIDFIKTTFDMTNPEIKKAATTLLTTIFIYVGPKIMVAIEDIKPHILLVIKEEFEKVKDNKPPKPTRGISIEEQVAQKNSEPESDECDKEIQEIEKESDENNNLEELITRVDVSSQLTSELLAELSDTNWKIRNEALEKISSIIDNAKFLLPNIGELPQALVPRLNENNKNIVVTSLQICKKLAFSIGVKISDHKQTLIPPIIQTLRDGKPQLRAISIDTLNEWVSKIGLPALLQGQESFLYQALKNSNAFCRAELMTWLSDMLTKIKNLDAALLIPLIDPILANSSDRSPDVRKAAQAGFLSLLPHVEVMVLKSSLDSCNSNQKSILQTALEISAKEWREKALATKNSSNPVKVRKSKKPKVISIEQEEIEDISMLKMNEEAKSKTQLPEETDHPAILPEPVKQREPTVIIQETKLSSFLTYKLGQKAARLNTCSTRNFISPKDYIYLLASQFSDIFPPSLHTDMFSQDFRKHNNAIGILLNLVKDNKEIEIISLFECSDLIYGWLSFRLLECNPSFLTKGLDFLEKYAELFVAHNQVLAKTESDILIPVLISKLCENKDTLRKQIHSLLSYFTKLVPSSVMISYLITAFTSAKISRLRIECITVILSIYESMNLPFLSLPGGPQLCATMGKFLSEKDVGLKNCSISYLSYVYSRVGEQVFEYVGKINQKEKELLQSRIQKLPAPAMESIILNTTATAGQSLLNSTFDMNDSGQNGADASVIQHPTESDRLSFNLQDYLNSMGVFISTQTLELKVVDPTCYEEFKPPFFKSQSDLSLNEINEIFSQLNLIVENIPESMEGFNEFVSHVPLTLKSHHLTEECSNIISNNMVKLFVFLEEKIKTSSASKSLCRDIFYICNYIFHYAPFIHSISVSSCIKLFHILLRLLTEEQIAICTDVTAVTLNRLIKGLISHIVAILPIHIIIHALSILSIDSNISENCIYYPLLKTCIITTKNRLKNTPNCVFMNIKSIMELFNTPNPIPLSYSSFTSLSDNYKGLYDELCNFFKHFILYINNNNDKGILSNLQFDYSIVYERLETLKIEIGIAWTWRPAQSVYSELLHLLDNKLKRFVALKKIYNLSLEHNFDPFQSSLFHALPNEAKIFLRFGFIIVRDNKVDSIISMSKNVQQELIKENDIDLYTSRYKKWKIKLKSIMNCYKLGNGNRNGDHVDETLDTIMKSISEKSPPSKVQIARSELSLNATNKASSNISDLRKRFETLKKGFPL